MLQMRSRKIDETKAEKTTIKGLVWDIQRFNMHDGDGIRTLVFLKGCPLRCLWCSNPEGMNPAPEPQVFEERCIHCGSCEAECLQNAISYGPEQTPTIDPLRCRVCGACVDACPSGALAVIGREMTVEQVLDEVRKDMAFYWRSGGGMTVTGGEPTGQDEFVCELLKAANDINIDTAIETSGYACWAKLERLVPYTDTFLYDIKHMDSRVHRELTGVPNELILDNARRITQFPDTELVFRTPIIPGKTDDEENLVAIAECAARLDISRWDLLPYHRFGEGKYQRMGRDYPLGRIEPPHPAGMREILTLVEAIFPRVAIESVW